jgi:predicted phosphodiesterase
VWLFISSGLLMPQCPRRNFSGAVSEHIALRSPGVFRLAVLSDVHDNFRVMDAVMRDAEDKADAAIELGDFSQRGLIIEYRLYLERVLRAGWKIPLYTALGNHDLGFWDDTGGLFREVFGSDHFYWRFGDNLVLVSNNVEKERWPAETRWIKDTLDHEGPMKGTVLLLQHKPPYLTAEFPGMTLGASNRLAKIVRGRVDDIVAGHAHVHKEFKWSGIPVTVLASAGGWQEADPPQYGYLLIECDQRECKSAYHELGYVAPGPQAAKILLVDCYWGWLILSLAAAATIIGAHFRKRWPFSSRPSNRPPTPAAE